MPICRFAAKLVLRNIILIIVQMQLLTVIGEKSVVCILLRCIWILNQTKLIGETNKAWRRRAARACVKLRVSLHNKLLALSLSLLCGNKWPIDTKSREEKTIGSI